MRSVRLHVQYMNILEYIFDFVFPPSKDQLVVREVDLAKLAVIGYPQRYDDVTALLPFKNDTVRAFLHEAKFHGNRKATLLLGEILRTYLDILPHKRYTLIPIPLSPARYRARGYNQVAEIAKVACKENAKVTLHEKVLVRIKHTAPQTDLKKEERAENILGAFCVKTPEHVPGAHIILLDDVVTTGSTLREARTELQKYDPASVTMIALAH